MHDDARTLRDNTPLAVTLSMLGCFRHEEETRNGIFVAHTAADERGLSWIEIGIRPGLCVRLFLFGREQICGREKACSTEGREETGTALARAHSGGLVLVHREKEAGIGNGGRLALVTGASRELGLRLPGVLAGQGCDLVLMALPLRRWRGRRARSKKLGARVLAQSSDVRDPASVDYLFALVRGLRRPLDFLINNAGVGQPNRSVGDLPYPMWQEVIDTNLTGMFLMTQAGLVVMKRGVWIWRICRWRRSGCGRGSAAYSASKHGALGFTDTLRDELRGKGIRVIGLMPGATDTGIWNTIWPKAPRRKMMSAATVAQAVVNALLLPENSTVEKLAITPRRHLDTEASAIQHAYNILIDDGEAAFASECQQQPLAVEVEDQPSGESRSWMPQSDSPRACAALVQSSDCVHR